MAPLAADVDAAAADGLLDDTVVAADAELLADAADELADSVVLALARLLVAVVALAVDEAALLVAALAVVAVPLADWTTDASPPSPAPTREAADAAADEPPVPPQPDRVSASASTAITTRRRENEPTDSIVVAPPRMARRVRTDLRPT